MNVAEQLAKRTGTRSCPYGIMTLRWIILYFDNKERNRLGKIGIEMKIRLYLLC